MATDLFNSNPNNNYVDAGLSACTGANSGDRLEFVDGGIGIINGSLILAKIDFSDISIPISSYTVQTQILSEGEVTYIPGLTKGLQQRQQGFAMPTLVSTDDTLNQYFFQIDLSIDFYKSFRYTHEAIDASGNYGQNISVVDALNIAFDDAGIKMTTTMDASSLIFKGNIDGFDFDITNVLLTLTDASADANSPFPTGVNLGTYILDEDDTLNYAYAKYPNGAMQGIIMKGVYPSSTPMDPYDHWININHVTDYVTTYDPIDIANFLDTIEISFDPSITFGPFIDASIATYDGSILLPDTSIGPGSVVIDCSIIDCSILGSDVSGGFIGPAGYVYGSTLENIEMNLFMVDASERVIIEDSSINNSTIWNATISDTSIYNSTLYDVSILGCTLYNCTEEDLVDKENTRDILIDASIGILSTYVDSSTYYNKVIRKFDVGMNGCSTENIMSAGDYLDWITTNDYWNKFGDMYIWTTAPDGCSDCNNLIDGFYVFNPHTFDIKIEYMLFV